MTTEQFEQRLLVEESAVHFLSDSIADFLLTRGHAAKIGEIVSQVGKHIGASAKLIRQAMSDNAQFVGEERRWNLALRTQFHRPVEGSLRQTLHSFGKPMTVDALCNELAVLNARSADYFHALLPSFLDARRQTYFQTPDERWGLREWLLDIEATDEDELLLRNFFTDIESLKPLLTKLRAGKLKPSMSAADAAVALLAAAEPLETKLIAYTLWRVHGDKLDPMQVYLDLLGDERLFLLSGGRWMRADHMPGMTTSLQQLSALADVALEEEEVWEGPYVVSEDDLSEIVEFLVEHGRPQKLTDLIEAIFEYGPASTRFPQVVEGLMAAMQAATRLQLVGRQTWTLPALIPQEVLQVPESLLPEVLDPTLLPDPETDAELEDAGLESELALWVHDPRYEDFGGEHEVELSPEMMNGESTVDETRIPLLYNHRRMGTLKVRQADMSFFPTDTPLACVTVDGEEFNTFQIWINNDELLIHGLADWYEARRIPVGAMLIFRRGKELDDYLLSWEGTVDELIALSDERISELLELREQAEANSWAVYEIICRTLTGRPEGAPFLTVWAEVNVVRRTPKRVVASDLSSYHCFSLISGTTRWKFDERKVEQGRKKTKKKFIIA